MKRIKGMKHPVLCTVLAFAIALSGPVPLALTATFDTQSIFHSKSKWKTHEGKEVTVKTLRGKSTVLAMFYTGCQVSCPLTVADLKAIEKALSTKAKEIVQFAVFSFDSESDTPSTLKSFAGEHSIDLKRWTLFNGRPASVRNLAALLGVRFKKLDDGSFDHSNVISLLSPDGVIIHQQIGLRKDPAEIVKKAEKLASDGTAPESVRP